MCVVARRTLHPATLGGSPRDRGGARWHDRGGGPLHLHGSAFDVAAQPELTDRCRALQRAVDTLVAP
jgi:hypothetical protein